MKHRYLIVVAEPAPVLAEGLRTLLLQLGHTVRLIDGLDGKIWESRSLTDAHALIVNASLAYFCPAEFRRLRRDFPRLRVIGMLSQLLPETAPARFDGLITPGSSAPSIGALINGLLDNVPEWPEIGEQVLSDRETDVLSLLVKGLSNKEIADRLNISIHTVVSHRKNIGDKTGIKSLPGLTIYALSHNIVPLGEF
jgi:DNA-binding CsgD family transcriptional regulator